MKHGITPSELVQIEAADRRLLDGFATAMQEAVRRSGSWIACRPGCTQCCMGTFDITALDAMRLQRGFAALAAAAPPRAAQLRARVAAYPTADGDDAPCPALDPQTGLCDLYEWRPVTCRVFGPVTRVEEGLAACELCYTGATEEEMAACAVDFDPEHREAAILATLGEETATTVAEALKPLCS